MNRNFTTSFLITTISYLIIFCQVPPEVRNERKETKGGEVGYVQSQTIITFGIILYIKFNKQLSLVFPHAMKKVQVYGLWTEKKERRIQVRFVNLFSLHTKNPWQKTN